MENKNIPPTRMFIPCEVCENEAEFIAEEDFQPLCRVCAINNEEAREHYPQKNNLRTFILDRSDKNLIKLMKIKREKRQ